MAAAAKAVVAARTAANCVRPKSATVIDLSDGKRIAPRVSVAADLAAAYPRRTPTGGWCATADGGLDDGQSARVHRVDLVALRVEGLIRATREQIPVRRVALVGVGQGLFVATDDRRNGHVETASDELLLPAQRQSGDGAAEHGLAHQAEGLRRPPEGGGLARAGRRERAVCVCAQVVLPMRADRDRLRAER